MYISNFDDSNIEGQFVTIDQERYYAINNVDQMTPFFISVISDNDHWLFISSNGALTAGRGSPDTALFPYECVDKLYDDYLNTGSKTILRVSQPNGLRKWEPFNTEHNGIYAIQRNIYKSTLGNKLCFEEINHDLNLSFKYYWESSEEFGFVRRSELSNTGSEALQIELLDGLQNLLPAGTPKFTQTVSSNLVDAYKWSERLPESNLAMYTLYSGITDRAEPCESLNATTVFSIGLDSPRILLSATQLAAFRQGKPVEPELQKRGIRGAYFVNQNMLLAANEKQSWSIVANLEQTQTEVTKLHCALDNELDLQDSITASVAAGNKQLASIMAAADGFQATNEENVSVHHYANTVFNVLRGGIFNDQYTVSMRDFANTIGLFNEQVFNRHRAFLESLPETLQISDLQHKVAERQDPQLARLTTEYLPIYFGRRHGDPSRPWNQFSIKLKDNDNKPLLTYQGNWRDIFQNWEALSFSYPEFIEGVISKFVNASTIDGYNPYRITKEGIDWEVEEPDDPWSYIGYWGDHQIIYLLKMLEMSKQFHPSKLQSMLHNPIYCYANVPYRIKHFDDLIKNAKDTVTFDEPLAEMIEQRVESIGADGKLLLDQDDNVYQVNLLEKLLVPLLSKLGNLVIDGGIWLNTQRPEWNDANNALVGQGLSMVTLNYLRRYVSFMQDLLVDNSTDVTLSAEVKHWLDSTLVTLVELAPQLNNKPISAELRFKTLEGLGRAASDFRLKVYKQHGFSGKSNCDVSVIKQLLTAASSAIEHTIHVSKGNDGLYHAYNLLNLGDGTADVNHLYPMLEGQVAALSSGLLSFDEVIDVTQALFDSDVYRPDQNTFMLYPDRPQTAFMLKNVIAKQSIDNLPTLAQMVADKDQSLIVQSVDGVYRFNSEMTNKNSVIDQLKLLAGTYPSIQVDSDNILDLYENTFDHQSFTGRSGGMFGFEGLGCIYWHMVSKMLLALAENYAAATKQNADQAILQKLGDLYYKVREGIGFNKSPEEYGAFPTDPYSHTPKHAGAQQPGMTGQVKEEMIARFTELGIRVENGAVEILPSLLRIQEFLTEPRDFWYLDVQNEWQKLVLDRGALAFTWCQVPFIYVISDSNTSTQVTFTDGNELTTDTLGMNNDIASALFSRSGSIASVTVTLPASLFRD